MPFSFRLWLNKWSLLRLAFLGGLYLVALFIFVAVHTRHPDAFNSDDLYCPSVCEDLLRGRDMQGWHFTAVPYLFPDLTLLLPCVALSSNLVVVFLAYNFLVYNLFGIVLVWIFRLTGLGWLQAIATSCVSVLFLLVTHLEPAYLPRALSMYQPGFHVGAVLAGLFLTALLLHGLRHGVGKKIAVAIPIVTALAAFSDRLLLPEFVGPLLAALCLLAVLRSVPQRRLLALGLLLGMGTVLSNGVRWCFVRVGFHYYPVEVNLLIPKLEYVEPFARQFRVCMQHQTLLHVLLPLYLAIGLAVLLYGLWKRRAAPTAQTPSADPSTLIQGFDRPAVLFVAACMTLSPLCNVATLFLTGVHVTPPMDRYLFACWLLPFLSYTDTGSATTSGRYLFACWLLPFLFFGLFVQISIGRTRRWGEWGFQLAVVLFAIYRIGTSAGAMDFSNYNPPYPPLAQTLDRLVRERGSMRGVAGYWVARRTDFLSRERVPVHPVCADCSPYFHAYNPNRFLFDEPTDFRLPRYNFVIVSPYSECGTPPNPERVRCEFGEPKEIIPVDGHEIWMYEQLSSPRFDRFLESQLAQRLCRHVPYIAPASPAALRKPKPNEMPWWSSRNVRSPHDENVEIHFDPPVRGDLIDVGANSHDEYLLTFCCGKELMATMEVPAVIWTGSIGKWCMGIQSRLLPTPASLRGRYWDRVLVRSIGPSSESSLGHFLVFDTAVKK
jgi:hypothetical protein